MKAFYSFLQEKQSSIIKGWIPTDKDLVFLFEELLDLFDDASSAIELTSFKIDETIPKSYLK
jgi:hypothetical protein